MLEDAHCPTCGSYEKSIRHTFYGGPQEPKKICVDNWHWTNSASLLPPLPSLSHRVLPVPAAPVTEEPEFKKFMRDIDRAFRVPIDDLQAKFGNESTEPTAHPRLSGVRRG